MIFFITPNVHGNGCNELEKEHHKLVEMLKSKGHTVYDSVNNSMVYRSIEQQLSECDAILLMDGWEKVISSTLDVNRAIELGLEIYTCIEQVPNLNKKELKAMQLKDTINLMCSEDYQERMLAEYQQTYIRFVNLRRLIVEYAQGKLDYTPKHSLEMLQLKFNAMGDYLEILFTMLLKEGIPLDVIEKVKE